MNICRLNRAVLILFMMMQSNSMAAHSFVDNEQNTSFKKNKNSPSLNKISFSDLNYLPPLITYPLKSESLPSRKSSQDKFMIISLKAILTVKVRDTLEFILSNYSNPFTLTISPSTIPSASYVCQFQDLAGELNKFIDLNDHFSIRFEELPIRFSYKLEGYSYTTYKQNISSNRVILMDSGIIGEELNQQHLSDGIKRLKKICLHICIYDRLNTNICRVDT